MVGGIRYGPTGEWATPRIVYVQFQDTADKNLEQFRGPGKQGIVAADGFKTGEARPFRSGAELSGIAHQLVIAAKAGTQLSSISSIEDAGFPLRGNDK